ncbi:hypothetical protein [Marinobacter sp. CA1]|uniref:hypothetical protein n=1 Tax=Marinobacter sp. CA1 TaxID=2817656 RepID=UPI001D07C0CA|nr:hypothetical protein [Marinobacter sp. CA1]UDL03971.1 hypothetical protein J2887_14780 [Marinobacter sp. CA1]
MITLSDGTATVEIPYDLAWTDRTWSPVAQSVTRSVTGAAIIMAASSLYGRPITLQAPARGGWMLVSNEAQIIAWHNEPGLKLVLDFHGETHTVRFAHHNGLGYESTPVRYQVDPGPDHLVIPTFRFITVEP